MANPHRPELSVVIPALSISPRLLALLHSFTRHQDLNLEVILVGPDCEPASVETEGLKVRVVPTTANRSRARNLGVAASSAEKVLFVDSDMELDSGVVTECIRSGGAYDAMILHEVVRPGNNYWAKSRAFERDAYFKTGIFEAARLIKKDIFEKLGGYDERFVGLEDMELQARLVEGRLTIGWVDACLYHHEESVGLVEYLRKRADYSHVDRLFRATHKEYFGLLSSPYLRAKYLLRAGSRRPLRLSLYLVPGLLLQRSLEYAIRTWRRLSGGARERNVKIRPSLGL